MKIDYKSFINSSYTTFFEELGFVKDKTSCTFYRLVDGTIIQHIYFQRLINTCPAYVIPIHMSHLFIPMPLEMDSPTGMGTVYTSIGHFMTTHRPIGRFSLEDGEQMTKDVEEIKNCIYSDVIPWFNKFSTVLETMDLMKGHFGQPDAGWKNYALFFTLLYTRQYEKAKVIGEKVRDEHLPLRPMATEVFLPYYDDLVLGNSELIELKLKETLHNKLRHKKLRSLV